MPGKWGSAAGGRVLVVDGERAICDFIASVLTDIDYDVRCATSVREAQELARRERFDVAFVEVMLTDGRGEELGAFLTDLGVRTTLMSGHPAGIEIGNSAPQKFLAKPFSVSALLRILVYQSVERNSADRE